MNATVELGSQQVTSIEVFHLAHNGFLLGLVFFTEEKEIARIGTSTHRGSVTGTIQLQKGEIWCGVSSSTLTGMMEDCEFIFAQLE